MKGLIIALLAISLAMLVAGTSFAGSDDGRCCNKRNWDGENTGLCVDNHIINYHLYMTCGWALKNDHCRNDHECVAVVDHMYDAYEGEPCTVELQDSPRETKKPCCTSGL